jgi:hypothetical protein
MNSNRSTRATSLRTRPERRIAVAITLATTALFGSVLPSSFHGLGIVVVVFLVALDILLIRATEGLAFTRRRTLDERKSALRDRAYRRGFRLLGLALAVELLIFIASESILSAIATTTQNGSFPSITEVSNVISGRGLTAIVELLVMLPTMMIAWSADASVDGENAQPARRWWPLWLSIPVIAGAWFLLVSAAPEQAAAASNNSVSGGLQGATCTHFSAGRIVGAEFGATVGLRAEVCWNGTDAFVSGDPSIPLPPSAIAAMHLPPGVPPDGVNPAQTDLTACGADNLDDFTTVLGTTCTGTIDAAGTLHYTVRARLSALPGGIGERDVTMSLVVARDGRVLDAP